MTTRLQGLLIAMLILCSNATLVGAKHIQFSLKPTTLTLKPGEQTVLKLTLTIDEGWYTYGLVRRADKDGIGPQPTEITLTPASPLVLGAVKAPKPKQKFDQGFQITIDYYEREVVFTLPVKVAAATKPGTYTTAVFINYMVCDAQRCLPPTDDSVKITLIVAGGTTSTAITADTTRTTLSTQAPNDQAPSTQAPNDQAPSTQAPNDQAPSTQAPSNQAASTQAPITNQPSNQPPLQSTESQSEIAQKRKEGIWSFLWFAMGAGASALLTPCVFPMVPITVSFFTKRAEKKRGRGLRDSLVYSMGIIFTFTMLGFLLSLMFGATGISDFAANPWVNVALAALFIVLAFNLFGAFEIPLPTGLLNKMNAASGSGDSIGAVLLMAITFSITSFTCTVPFVGAALVSASTGEWFHPLVGMAGFSAVFAAPFFLLALFPSAMTRLPKAGGWMNNVKVVMGFLEIAAAMKFVSNSDLVWGWGMVSRHVFLAIWIGCGFMITLYVLGVFRLAHDSPVQSVGAVRVSIALMFVSLTFYLFSGLFGNTLGELDAFLPPKDYDAIIRSSTSQLPSNQAPSNQAPSNQSSTNHAEWLKDYEEGLREAQRTGKPVFVDFTGFTCTNCRWMEANMFTVPEVRELMNGMVNVQLFTDRKTEPYLSNKKRQLEQFGSIELPLYVLLKPDGSVIATKAFTRDRQEFISFLRKAL